MPSIAMVALIAVVIVALLRRRGAPASATRLGTVLDDDRVGVLSAGFLWTLLFFVTAGLGTIFAFLVSPEIRAWSRISIVLSVFALAFLALLVNGLVRRRTTLVVSLVVIAAIAFVDQVPGIAASRPIAPSADSEIASFSAAAEKTLPRNCGVVQLPIKGFPETGAINQMGDYDEGLPYVYAPTSSLRWSYGAVQGTHSADFWKDATTPAAFKDAVERSGACAVLVDTRAYTTAAQWEPLVAAVADPAEPTLTSDSPAPRYRLFELSGR